MVYVTIHDIYIRSVINVPCPRDKNKTSFLVTTIISSYSYRFQFRSYTVLILSSF